MSDFDRLTSILCNDDNIFCNLTYDEITELAEHLIANGVTLVKEVKNGR